MASNRILCLFVVLLVAAVVVEGGRKKKEGDHEEMFLLQHSKHIVKTDAGIMRLVKGIGGSRDTMMHIGFITMEPSSLFIPQYLDASLILFVRQGEATVGHIHKDDLVERSLKDGDVYRIPAGSAFYLINTAEDQRLHVICSIDTTESLGWHAFQSFFIAGGTNPRSVLSGFDHLTLSAAFNISEAEVHDMLSRQNNGPIVFLTDSHSPSVWSKFMDMEHPNKLVYLRKIVGISKEDVEEEEEEEQQPTWSFRKFLITLFEKADKNVDSIRGKTIEKPDSYNIYDRKPDFENNYGWSVALDESEYSPLKDDDISVYLVNLSAGSMMAPHINPRATEYGIVLKGAGSIQIVYPNGSLAMNTKVAEGDVFWIPRYFPFCQIASMSGSFEFFGFTTSARDNKPQFLVGANSMMHKLRSPEFAAAFGMSEERLKAIINQQSESVILPAAIVAPPEETELQREVEVVLPLAAIAPPEKAEMQRKGEVDGSHDVAMMIRSLGNEMVMGFD